MIYLDNSATTKPAQEVCDKVYTMLTEHFGNPSSFHRAGLDANFEVRHARELLAKALSCEPEEVYFTSGGTEANNLAVFGAAMANKRKGNRIVTTAIEHESVLESVSELEKQGFEVVRLLPDKNGKIDEEQLYEAVDGNTILVTMMYVNNEVGSVLPVTEAKKAVAAAHAPALVHVDCVQAFGKQAVKPKRLGADLVSITAHKIHGPKGCGALYVRKGVRILPRQFGGAQESKLRPGTEAAPLIAGFGKAVELTEDLHRDGERVQALNAYARQALLQTDGVLMNSAEDASAYILNFYVPSFMTSQTIVQHLSSSYGICVSSGSACAKGKKSHVLTAMHLPDKVIEHSIRVSLSRYTTKEDIDALVSAVRETVQKYPVR